MLDALAFHISGHELGLLSPESTLHLLEASCRTLFAGATPRLAPSGGGHSNSTSNGHCTDEVSDASSGASQLVEGLAACLATKASGFDARQAASATSFFASIGFFNEDIMKWGPSTTF